jgi:hypothetical protein
LRDRIHVYGRMQYISRLSLKCNIYNLTGIDGDKVMESTNLLIGHKHDKEIYLIKRFVTDDYKRKFARVDVGEKNTF